MATFRTFNSNSLSFIRLEDYALLPTDTTRLNFDLDYPSITNDCYFTQIGKKEGLWFQYRTDYVNVAVKLVDVNGVETDISSSITFLNDLADGSKQYEVNINTLLYTGYHYVLIEAIDANKPVANFQSEWVDIQDSFDNSELIEWLQGSFPTYNDGILWGSKTQKIWLQSRTSDLVVGVNKSVYETANYELKTTQSQPLKSKNLQVEPIPPYLLEKLNIAMQMSNFYINKARYNSEETFDSERLGDINAYPTQIVMRLVEDVQGYAYEDYTEDITLSGSEPVFDDELRTTGLEDRTTGVEDRRTNN